MDFLDWAKVQGMPKPLSVKDKQRCKDIRINYNKTRKTFNWDHL
jgi:hypothetical protein